MNKSKCKCDNCSENASGDFAPGHDQRLRIILEQKVGGVLFLKELIIECEKYASGDSSEENVLRIIRHLFARK